MATKEEIAVAVKVINEVAGSPDSGVIADLVKDIEKSETNSDKSRQKKFAKSFSSPPAGSPFPSCWGFFLFCVHTSYRIVIGSVGHGLLSVQRVRGRNPYSFQTRSNLVRVH